MEIFEAISSQRLLSERTVAEFELSYDTREALREQLMRVEHDDQLMQATVWQQCGDAMERVLGEQMVEEIRTAVKKGAVVIRNLPTERALPKTPISGQLPIGEIGVSVAGLVAAHHLIGSEIVTYQGENHDKPLRHVLPHVHSMFEKSSHGSLLGFGMHVDNPHLPLEIEHTGEEGGEQVPRYLGLMALRSDLRVPTKVVFLDDILDKLPEYVIHTLRKPMFKLKWPDSFGDRYNQALSPVIVRGDDGVFYSRFDKHNVIPISEEAKLSLSIFQAVAESEGLVKKLLLLPGDLIVFDNQRMVHARDGFHPKQNGLDRWLIRLFGVSRRHKHEV